MIGGADTAERGPPIEGAGIRACFFDLGGTLLEIANDEIYRGPDGRDARGFIAQVNEAVGGTIADYRICMHEREAGCACRKPRPGLLLELLETYRLNPAACVLVGDDPVDRQAADAAGFGAFQWAWEFFGRPRPDDGPPAG